MSVEASEMSREDKFFGVTAPLQIPEKEAQSAPEEEVELEIVDDLPKKPVKQEAKEEENDEELSDYSEKVRKRINKLKYEQHEAMRQREAAEKMREEAVRFAQQLAAKNQQYESLIQRGEGALVQQIKSRASIALEQAKANYKEAYEQGDAEKIISAQEKLLTAQTELREAEKYEKTLQSRPKPQLAPQPQQVVQQQQYQAPKPSDKALEWTKRNPWFGPKGNREMTALAYAVHETLIREEGVKPDTDEYYEKIDAAVRSRFPEQFEKDELQIEVTPSRTPKTVVAPSTRNNGARPRKIQLTATQVSLARRLGLTPEQYAKQLIKESSNGR
jgi:hypothetical protein